MLIVRAPVRISLAGGGTDLEAYYGSFGGMVISATIDKYFYLFINATGDNEIQVMSSDYRTFYRRAAKEYLWDQDLALPKAVLDHFGVNGGLTMFLASEIPPGTGLGSSGAVTIALVKGISTVLGYSLTKVELAELACHIEIDKMGMPIGKQDQYASAYGGINVIMFGSKEVKTEPLDCPEDVITKLERRLMLFFTGTARNSSQILGRQRIATKNSVSSVINSLHAIKETAIEVKNTLERGELEGFSELLDRSWQYKKQLDKGITNKKIDECYEVAMEKGALGGKISGAGGGGFLMLYCPEESQEKVTSALEQKGLKRMSFRFENAGAQVLMNSGLKIRDMHR